MRSNNAARTEGQGIRQSMSDLHTWAGLLLGWVLYSMFLTGTVSYFKEELSQWMRPELARSAEIPDQAVVAQRIAEELGRLAPGTSQWSIRLPDGRNNSAYAFWRTAAARQPGVRAFDEANFDPATGERLTSRATLGGEFFYRYHYQFHYMPVVWGRWLAGAAAMFMLVAIISGVITHKKIFLDFFTFRWGKGQRSWLDAHNALSVFGLPFHFMITYTGLITLMALYMPWGESAAFKTPAERQEMTAELSAFIQPGKPSGQKVALASIEDMVRQAEARWGRGNVGRVNAAQPGDAAGRIAVTRGEAARVSMSPQYMEFDGATGKLLAVRDQVGGAAETRGVLYALHMGRFSDLELRWLYFLVGSMGVAMVGTGLVMWTVKRRQKLRDPDRPYFGFRLVERLNIASIAGLSIAMTSFLWANRLLPRTLEGRADWEVHVFFIAWALTLFHALLRPARSAWVEQLWAASILLFLLPLSNMLMTQRPLWQSLATGDWVFAGVDLMCWALALLHAVLAMRTARQGAVATARRPKRQPSVSVASGEGAR